MRSARTLWIAGAVLLAAFVAALWFGPRATDWNRYRADIAARASASLGRPVRIAGNVRLVFLPEPALSADGVTIGGSGIGMDVPALHLRVSLWPLLTGRVVAKELVLDRPVLTAPWPVSLRPLAPHPRWLASVDARIANGVLVLGPRRFDALNAVLSLGADGLHGAGTARFHGQAWRYRFGLGIAGGDGASVLQASLAGDPATASISARIFAQGDIDGTVRAGGPDLSALLAAPAVPFHAEGQLAASADKLAADDIVLKAGDTEASGAVSFPLRGAPRLRVKLAAGHVDVAAWLPTLLRGVPPDLPVALDFSADSATYRGGRLRHVHAALTGSGGAFTIADAGAELPGGATLSLAGDVRAHIFTGHARLAAPDLRATLRWAAGLGLAPLAHPPEGVLRDADVHAAVRIGAGGIVASGIAGTLDGGAVQGSLGAAPGAHPAFTADLAFDALALDPWLAAAAVPRGFDANISLRARSARFHQIAVGDFQLDAEDVHGALTVRAVSGTIAGARLHASGVRDETGRLRGVRVDIAAGDAEPLVAMLPLPPWLPADFWHDQFTLHAEASGTARLLDARISATLGDLHLDAGPTLDIPDRRWSGPVALRDPAAASLFRRLSVPGIAAWLGEGSLALSGAFQVGPNVAQVHDFTLTAGALRASGTLAADSLGAEPHLAGRLHCDALPLPPFGPPLWSESAPLPLGALHGWEARVHIVAAQVLRDGAEVAQAASAEAILDHGVFRLQDVSARVAGGTLTGAASVDAAREPPAFSANAQFQDVTIAGALTGLPLDLAAGTASGAADITAQGHSLAALRATLAGTASLSAVKGGVQGFDLAGVATLLDQGESPAPAMRGGTTPFDRFTLDTTLRDGRISLGETMLHGAAGQAIFSGGIDLADGTLDLHAVLHPAMYAPPALGLTLSGPLADPARSLDLSDMPRWRTADPPH